MKFKQKQNITSPSNSKIARQTFKDEKNKIANNQKFINQITSKKIEAGIATTAESRLIKARIDFAQGRMTSLNEMSEIMSEFLASKNVVEKRADRIIAAYLAEKRESAELSI